MREQIVMLQFIHTNDAQIALLRMLLSKDERCHGKRSHRLCDYIPSRSFSLKVFLVHALGPAFHFRQVAAGEESGADNRVKVGVVLNTEGMIVGNFATSEECFDEELNAFTIVTNFPHC